MYSTFNIFLALTKTLKYKISMAQIVNLQLYTSQPLIIVLTTQNALTDW